VISQREVFNATSEGTPETGTFNPDKKIKKDGCRKQVTQERFIIACEFIHGQTFIIFEIFVPNIGPDSKTPARRETYILLTFQGDQSRTMPTKKPAALSLR
jgi:hypothetical protein